MPMAVSYTVIDGEIVSETRGGVSKAYAPDSLGSTIALYDASGNITDTWEYWPYGEVRTRTGTTPTPFQYVGTLGYYTDATGNLYVRARSYQPKTTRWMSVDPLWPSERAYQYCYSDPLIWVDPSGLQSTRKPTKPWKLPYRGRVDWPWSYGRYCGSANVKNPGWEVPPQDCTDSCCRDHDRCLEANQGFGNSNALAHMCCDAQLLRCTRWAFLGSCCKSTSENPALCKGAAFDIIAAFGAMTSTIYPEPWEPRECVPHDQWGCYVRIWWGNDYRSKPMQGVYTGPPTWNRPQ